MRKPKIESCRKLGNLFQVCFGHRTGAGLFYGYGVTRAMATYHAKRRYRNAEIAKLS